MPRNVPKWLSEELEKKGGLKEIIRSLPPSTALKSEAKIYAALGDPNRLKILCFLGKQTSCVCLIRVVTNLTYSKLSYHLSIMRKAGLIKGKKEGNYIIYSLTELGEKYYQEICKKQ